MKQKGVVNRIMHVFSLVGKPLYLLLISPFIIFETLKKLRQAIGSRLGVMSRRFLRARSKYLRKLAKSKKVRRVTKKPTVKKRFVLRPPLFTGRQILLSLFLLATLSLSYTSYMFYIKILKDLPTPADLIAHTPHMTTKIYDRNRILLYKIFKDENRSYVPLDQISNFAKDATIAIEDRDFYNHRGFSLRGIARSIKLALTEGRMQGGSTITQQLVKNTLLTSKRTLQRKIKEIILAVQVEATLSKERILEMYLNEVSYGGSVYGIEEAAQKYFQISAKDLNLAQSAFLAGLPASPSVYTPFGSHPELAYERQREVLRRMVEDGKISGLEAESAKNETLNISPVVQDIKAPHFVMYVRDLLAKRYGEDLVSQGGLEVVTTLDYELQQEVEKIVKDEIKSLARLRVGNGAALVTNPQTGEVLAMVGSQDFFDNQQDGQVNVTIRPRQPGSSIKPLMYSAALEKGYTPATLIDDSPIVYQIPGSPPYAPKNYDGRFHGKESLRVALASSHNVPAVKVESAIGLPAFIEKARALGISTWENTSRFGLSLTLGSGEVLMTDMATAYGTFANGGKRVDLNPLQVVKSYTGESLYENHCTTDLDACSSTTVLDPRVAYQITSILSDNNARARAFGISSVLHIPGQQVAVKTGTTNSLKDNWTFGYTQNRVVAVWVGNNDNTPMSSITSGITGASPIWNKIMRTQLDAKNPHAFGTPQNLQAVRICFATGRPICGECAASYTEYFLPGTVPSPLCVTTLTDGTQVKTLPPPANTALHTKILEGVSTQNGSVITSP